MRYKITTRVENLYNDQFETIEETICLFHDECFAELLRDYRDIFPSYIFRDLFYNNDHYCLTIVFPVEFRQKKSSEELFARLKKINDYVLSRDQLTLKGDGRKIGLKVMQFLLIDLEYVPDKLDEVIQKLLDFYRHMSLTFKEYTSNKRNKQPNEMNLLIVPFISLLSNPNTIPEHYDHLFFTDPRLSGILVNVGILFYGNHSETFKLSTFFDGYIKVVGSTYKEILSDLIQKGEVTKH